MRRPWPRQCLPRCPSRRNRDARGRPVSVHSWCLQTAALKGPLYFRNLLSQSQDFSAHTIRHHVERAVRTFADAADARVEISKQPLFADHAIAVEHETDKVFADKTGDEQVAVPRRKHLARVKCDAG